MARFCEECGGSIEAEPPSVSARPPEAGTIRIGSNPDNDIVLDSPVVAAFHALLRVQDRILTLEDLGSGKGTAVDDPANLVTKTQVSLNARIYFGSFPVSVRRLVRADNMYLPDQINFVPYPGRQFTLGQSNQNQLTFGHKDIAPEHAEFHFTDKGLLLKKINANQIQINGQPMPESQQILKPGDQLHFGPLLLIPRKKGFEVVETWRLHHLEARNISKNITDRSGKIKTILNQLSFVIYPGELCGLMGLAGAGKSSLMRALNGYDQPSDGKVLINGVEIYRHFDSFKTTIGYVPQEDIFHKDLTVEQALGYAAELRTAHPLTCREKHELIDRVLEKLTMFETNPQIRTTRINQISGGQRRRLNIAIELLTDPYLFFLDEPTSGLSSEDALVVMNLLREMALEGRTILLSLHQPGAEIFGMMDNIIYLHRGGVMAYKGPGLPDAILFTNPELKPEQATSPELVLRALDGEPPETWRRRYKKSPYFNELIRNRHLNLLREPGPPIPKPEVARSSLFQLKVLLKRHLRVTFQDRLNSLVLMLQSPVIAALIALVFNTGEKDNTWKTAPTVHFLMVIASIWFGCSNSAREICSEWAIYQRERMYNLKIIPYVLSKMVTGIMISLVQCLILILIVKSACDLKAPLSGTLLILWAASASGICIGLFISAFASPFKKSNEIAVGLIPIILLPMVILCGLIKPIKEMNDFTLTLASAMPTRWAFEAVMVLEAANTTGEISIETPMGEVRKTREEAMMEPLFDNNRIPPIKTGMTPIFIGILFLIATMIYLRKRDLFK